MYYLLVDSKGEPYNGALQTNKDAKELQKLITSLQEQGFSGMDLIDELEDKGIKYIHLEETFIAIE